jgi:hypothetical protein
MEQFKCTKCGKIKDESSFRPMTGKMKLTRKRSVRYWCKECESEYIKSDLNKILSSNRNKRARIAHPKKLWAQNTIGQHKMRGFNVSLSWRTLVILADSIDNCPICGCKLDWTVNTKQQKAKHNSPSLDRINNETEITDNNSWIICHRCNVTKSDRTLIEFYNYCENILKRRNENVNQGVF